MTERPVNNHATAATTPLGFGLHAGTKDTSAPQKRKARILVVDDDPGLLRLLTIRLRAENYEVEAVESAAAALAACTRFRPGPRDHRSAHGSDGRHRAAQGAAEPLAGTAR